MSENNKKILTYDTNFIIQKHSLVGESFKIKDIHSIDIETIEKLLKL